MSRVSNEVFDTPFTAVELTNSINRVPFRARSLDGEFDWETTLSPTTGVRINIGTESGVEIASYVPRGGVPDKVGEDDRSAVTVEIPAIAARAEAMNREALNVTAGLDGEDRLLSLEQLRDQKARKMARAIDEGEARQCVEAIKGLGTDPKTGRTVFDLYKLLGQKQLEFDLDVSSGVYGLNEQLEDIKEASEQAVGGAAGITGFKLIMADVASRKIRATKDYKELLTNNPTATILAKIDGRKNLVINDNVDLVHYRFGHMAPTDAFLVPIYAGHAQIVYGPHEADEFWGKILARYVTSEPMPHGKGIEMEAWSYVLRYFQHPEAIFKIKVVGGN